MQNYSFSSTRNSVSKLCRSDLQYLGLKTRLKTVNFQLFCWVLLFQYSKKFDFSGGCNHADDDAFAIACGNISILLTTVDMWSS